MDIDVSYIFLFNTILSLKENDIFFFTRRKGSQIKVFKTCGTSAKLKRLK